MQPHSTLDFMVCVGMLLVVVGKVGGLDCDTLNDVIVHDILPIANHLLLRLIIMFGLAKITQLMRRSQ